MPDKYRQYPSKSNIGDESKGFIFELLVICLCNFVQMNVLNATFGAVQIRHYENTV